MTMTSCYPVLMTGDVAQAADYFRAHFGFTTTAESDWYVSLELDGAEIAVVDHRHPTVPAGYGVETAGVLVNLEVDDVDAVYQRLVVDGPLEALLELRSEPFGQRHFIVRGPARSLVDVITEIPFSGEYADGFH